MHAFLSPSSYHWVNYDEEKLAWRYKTALATIQGVHDHAYAAIAIAEGEVQDDETTTLGLYINDCIHHKMTPEQVLYYSPNCFGTADAISYRYRVLRIKDLKTGDTKTSPVQLEIYAALFCLEYGVNPFSCRGIFLDIYQHGKRREYIGDPVTIKGIMEKIIRFDVELNQLREGVS